MIPLFGPETTPPPPISDAPAPETPRGPIPGQLALFDLDGDPQ